MEFAYLTWQEFPNRLVGFDVHSHYLNQTNKLWRYSEGLINGKFSILLLTAAFYHRLDIFIIILNLHVALKKCYNLF